LFENKEAKKLYPWLGVVTGLTAEARIVGRLGVVAAGGGQRAGAEAAAERLVAQGATALLSFGLAGGLDPALRPGALVIPAAVLDSGERLSTAPTLTALLGGATTALLLQGERVLATAAAKAAAFAATSAAAVDLESGAVARAAARHGLPFAVLRAVCDPAGRPLPPAALAALDSAGAIGLWRVLASVLARPGQVPGLLALAADAARARAALTARVTTISMPEKTL
jgi:adenosylhomocysteine nucleosidase